MKKAISFTLALIMISSAFVLTGAPAQAAFVGEDTKQFQDFFRATPLRTEIGSFLDPNAWGAQTRTEWSTTADPVYVGARDQNNGLESKNLGEANKTERNKYWDYWDGSIFKADDGKFHIICSRWDKANGHNGWVNSMAVHAVSDDLYGPYTDLGLCYTDTFNGLVGAGHNIAAVELHPDDASGFRYALTTSDSNNPAWGRCWGSDDLYTWTQIGRFFRDNNSANIDFAGNFVVMRAPDDNPYGRYISIGREFEVATSDHIQGPWTLRFRGFGSIPGCPTANMEDPLIFYCDGLYHAVFNQWSTMRAFWFISENGVDGWKLQPGYAYNPRQDIVFYEDELGEKYHVNHWGKMERPFMYMEDGLPVAMSFASINSAKNDDRNLNDNNGSKIVIIPFDGEAFRDYVRTKVTRGSTLITAEEDAHVAGNAQTTNYGTANPMEVRMSRYNGDYFGETTPTGVSNASSIAYLKFDLTPYVAAGSVGLAQLELMYVTRSGFTSGSASRLYVVSADSNWTETGITWQNKPALDFEGGISVSSPIDLNYSSSLPRLKVTADVTDLINAQLRQGKTKVTLAFCETLPANQALRFDSRHSGTAGFRPMLNIVSRPDLLSILGDAEAELASKMPGVFALPKSNINAALRAVIDDTWEVYNDPGAAGVKEVVAFRALSEELAKFRSAYSALAELLGLITEAQAELTSKQPPYPNPVTGINNELAAAISAAQAVSADPGASEAGIRGAIKTLQDELIRFKRVYNAIENDLFNLITTAKAELAAKHPDVFPLASTAVNDELKGVIDTAQAIYDSINTAAGADILKAMDDLSAALDKFANAYVFILTISPNANRLLFTAQTVTITGPVNDGVEIRYTLNGADPTIRSSLYSGPFVISEGIANVRAAMFIKASGEKYGETYANSYMVVPAYNSSANIAYNKTGYTPNNIYSGQGTDRALNGNNTNRLSWMGSAGTYTLRVDLGATGTREFNTVTLEEYSVRTGTFSVYGSDSAVTTNGPPAGGTLLGKFSADDLDYAKNYILLSSSSYDSNHSFYGMTLSTANTFRYIYLVMDCSVEGSIWQFGLYNLASVSINPDIYSISGSSGALTVSDLAKNSAVTYSALQNPVPDAQAWKVEYRSANLAYAVISTTTGRALTVDGAQLRQSPFTGAAGQLWEFNEGMLVSKANTALTFLAEPAAFRLIRYLPDSLTVSAPKYNVSIGGRLQLSVEYDPPQSSAIGVDWSVEPGTGMAGINADGIVAGEAEGAVTVYAQAKIGGAKSDPVEISVTEKGGIELIGDVIWVGDPRIRITQGSSGNGGNQNRNFGNLKTDNFDPNTIGLFFPENATNINKNFINGLDSGTGTWGGYADITVDIPEAAVYTLNILCQGNAGRRFEVTVNGLSRGNTEGVVATASSPLVYSTIENLNVLQVEAILKRGTNVIRLQAPSGESSPNYVAMAISRDTSKPLYLIGDIKWVGSAGVADNKGTGGSNASRNHGSLKSNFYADTIGWFFPEVSGAVTKNYISALDSVNSTQWDGNVTVTLSVPEAGYYLANILAAGGAGRTYELTVNGASQGVTVGLVNTQSSDSVYSTATEPLNVLQSVVRLNSGANTIRIQAPSGGSAPNFIALAIAGAKAWYKPLGGVIWAGDIETENRQGSSGNVATENVGAVTNYSEGNISLFLPESSAAVSPRRVNGIDKDGSFFQGYINLHYNIPETGVYNLSILHFGGVGRSLEVSVNGAAKAVTPVVSAALPAYSTGTYPLRVATVEIELQAGQNVITLQAPSGASAPNFAAAAVTKIGFYASVADKDLSAGTLEVTTLLENYVQTKQSARVILALYNEKGQLASVDAKQLELPVNSKQTVKNTVTGIASGYKAKLFIWDAGYIPLTEAYDIPLAP